MASKKISKKILIVVGTRPEVIKMAPVLLELKQESKFAVELCATGQHSDLLALALKDFDLSPEYSLDLMQHGQRLGSLTGRAISGIEGILDQAKPDAVLVHGDTTTTLAAAMTSFFAQIPVGHVEAGLRTRDLFSPFPEEFNRQAVSRLARWNFAPTSNARQNLLAEGVEQAKVIETGNTVVDTIRLIAEESARGDLEEVWSELRASLGFDPKTQKTVLVTTHRRENLGFGVERVFEAVLNLAKACPEVSFVLPLHPNPKIHLAAARLKDRSNIRVIEPLGYRQFLLLLSASHLVITDSGGIQEEAVTLGKQVLVARDTSERQEGMIGGMIRLIGASTQHLTQAGLEEISKPARETSFELASEVFGNGRAAKIIRNTLYSDLF